MIDTIRDLLDKTEATGKGLGHVISTPGAPFGHAWLLMGEEIHRTIGLQVKACLLGFPQMPQALPQVMLKTSIASVFDWMAEHPADYMFCTLAKDTVLLFIKSPEVCEAIRAVVTAGGGTILPPAPGAMAHLN